MYDNEPDRKERTDSAVQIAECGECGGDTIPARDVPVSICPDCIQKHAREAGF